MSAPDYLLAIDQGTTSTRAILFDSAGNIRHTARVPLRRSVMRSSPPNGEMAVTSL